MSLKKIKPLEGGLEPPTLWLTATRSGQLSYSSFCFSSYAYILIYTNGLLILERKLLQIAWLVDYARKAAKPWLWWTNRREAKGARMASRVHFIGRRLSCVHKLIIRARMLKINTTNTLFFYLLGWSI